ncbi:U-box domain-containing protein 4 [Capsicum baccatum]|uniref:U-box domain-containing protein 4 n=1 Tax=Capsicum baccatum TaxID=33114 RepID=A0A2G2XGT0_CAPBA|nr:U-box domain-containing protein 4 [Capsicum baccatum]
MDHSWMYNMTNVDRMGLMPEFISGVDGFVDYAMTLEPFQLDGLESEAATVASGDVVGDSKPTASILRRESKFPLTLEKRSRNQSIWRRPSDRFPRIISSPTVEKGDDLSELKKQVKRLVEDLKHTSIDMQRTATAELWLLAKHNTDNRMVIAKCGAISLLVNLLHSEDMKIHEDVVTTFLYLSINDNNKCAIANADAVELRIHVEHETQIKANFKLKAGCILTGLLSRAREKNKRPRWILPENWQKLVDHWEIDSRFKQMREIGKKPRASLKGGSLHTSVAQSQENVRRNLEKELGRPITQAEAFKATHTRKKKTPEDPDVWVEPRAQLTYNFHQTLPEDKRDLPLSQEQNKRIWLDAVGGLSRYEYAYGLPQRTFREFHSELKGLGSFRDDESRETILVLKQQIVELSSEAKASQARERQRDIQYAGMKAQFDALLASGGIPPCPGDVVRPPRPPQSLPISHGVYGQYIDVNEEPNSDKDDYYVDNTPPRC